jgi:hypothetical protein
MVSAPANNRTSQLGDVERRYHFDTGNTFEDDVNVGSVRNGRNDDEEGNAEGEDSSDSDATDSSTSSIQSFMLAPTPVNTMVGGSLQLDPQAQIPMWNDDTDTMSSAQEASFSFATPAAGPPRTLARLPVPLEYRPDDRDKVDNAQLPISSLPVPPPPTLLPHNLEGANGGPGLSPTSLGPLPSRSDSVVGFMDTSTSRFPSTYSSADHINPLSTSTSTHGTSRIHLLGRNRRRSTPASSFSNGAEQSHRPSLSPGRTLIGWLGLGAHREDSLPAATSAGRPEPEGLWGTHSMVTTSRSDMHLTPEEIQRERDRKRLEQLGYSEVLGRDYGFWACFAVAFCNIGVSWTSLQRSRDRSSSDLFVCDSSCKELYLVFWGHSNTADPSEWRITTHGQG